jgi:hypothetical protein
MADYFLIGPYPEGREFRRADGMHDKVLGWVRQSRERVLILTGQSGTGKSSLLQAFVIPQLRAAGGAVVLVRSFDDPLADLRRQLIEPGAVWTKPPDDLAALPLEKLLDRALAQLRKKDPASRLIAVFDQFEELVILQHDGDARVEAVRSFLKTVRGAAPDGFTLLLSLRSDYKAFLEPLGVPPLQQGANWLEVPAFTHGDAADFLSASESGVKLAPERLRHVLTEAAAVDCTRGLIRPIILNMLGAVLRRIAGSAEAERPTRTLLADDLRRVVNAPGIRDLARPVLLKMLTDADTKRPCAVGELERDTGLAPHAIHGCLLDMELSGYVRQLSRPSGLAERVWEISHDFVARLLGPILKTPLQTLWHRTASVAYPLSITVWLLVVAGAIVAAPEWERIRAERALREMGFQITMVDGKWCAQQTDHSFSRLAVALPFFAKLPPISTLDLSWCRALTSVEGLKQLKDLQSLDLNSCQELRSVEGLKEHKVLKRLNLGGCSKLTSVEALKELKGLQSLNLGGCSKLTSVEALKELKGLQSLDLYGCFALTTVEPLKELKELQSLDLYGCFALTTVEPLKELKELQSLNLYGCFALTSVEPLKELKGLQSLNLTGCSKLTSVEPLKELKGLQSLNLTGCSKLTSVEVLKKLDGLRSLYLSDCPKLPKQSVAELRASLQQPQIFSDFSDIPWKPLQPK